MPHTPSKNVPIGPVILFDDDYYMYVLEDQASAKPWWEMPDEYFLRL